MKDLRLCVAGETEEGSEFQSQEVIGINELVNAYVQLVYNLISKGCLTFKNHSLNKAMNK